MRARWAAAWPASLDTVSAAASASAAIAPTIKIAGMSREDNRRHGAQRCRTEVSDYLRRGAAASALGHSQISFALAAPAGG